MMRAEKIRDLMRAAPMEEILAHSFRDFHVKGFDYLCLKRTPELTVKVYFFEGDVAKAPEVVNPHDHRYNSKTTVVCGRASNSLFVRDEGGAPFEEFEYRTPLNGGNGFTWANSTRLRKRTEIEYSAGQSFELWSVAIHTLRIVEGQTILLVKQFHDILPIGEPTLCFTRDREPISLTGLYSRFTADQALRRLALLARCLERSGHP